MRVESKALGIERLARAARSASGPSRRAARTRQFREPVRMNGFDFGGGGGIGGFDVRQLKRQSPTDEVLDQSSFALVPNLARRIKLWPRCEGIGRAQSLP